MATMPLTRRFTTLSSMVAHRSKDPIPTCDLHHFPLAEAYLCQDCNSVGNSSGSCPACASEVLLNLSGVLDRTPMAPTPDFDQYTGGRAYALVA